MCPEWVIMPEGNVKVWIIGQSIIKIEASKEYNEYSYILRQWKIPDKKTPVMCTDAYCLDTQKYYWRKEEYWEKCARGGST